MDLFDAKNKIVLITGASRGIGRGLARGFLEAGAIVYGTATSGRGVEAMQKENIRGRAVLAQGRADMDALMREIIAAHGRLDCLVANAGVYSHTPAAFVKDDEMTSVFDTNFNGVFVAAQSYYRAQKKSGGNIIIISSIVALRGVKSSAVYCASKGAVQELTRALAAEWAVRNFRVNAICPGFIDTDMADLLEKRTEIKNRMIASIPLNRLGRPEDLIGAAIYLASEASRWVTGQSIVVDGGTTSILPV